MIQWSLTNQREYVLHMDPGFELMSPTQHFPLPTSSLSSLALSPTGNHLAVWEGPLEYRLHIISLAGDLQASFTPDPDPGFGIRSVSWHPSGLFLAVGGWDDKIHILDNLSWSPVTTLELSSRIPGEVVSLQCHDYVVFIIVTLQNIWREPLHWLDSEEARGFLSCMQRLCRSITNSYSIQTNGCRVRIQFLFRGPTFRNPIQRLEPYSWNGTRRAVYCSYDLVSLVFLLRQIRKLIYLLRTCPESHSHIFVPIP